MSLGADTLFFAAGFALIALSSRQIGDAFRRYRLPLISGFLFTGILAGPYVLKLIPRTAVEQLRFVDQVALAFIAFAAGSELYLKELRSRLRSIAWITGGLVFCTFTLGSLTLALLSPYVPFMRDLPLNSRIAVALLAGAILVARSPSSAIAIVKELRAKGPFTQTVLGVTVIMDVVVIVLFALNSTIADALLTGLGVDLGFLLLLLGELGLSLIAGLVVWLLVDRILAWHLEFRIKTGLVLGMGYGVFLFSGVVREATHHHLGVEILMEPLLICMIGGFLVGNRSPRRAEFLNLLERIGPAVFIAFFTLTGASLALDVLVQTWPIALALFVVRGMAIFVGSFSGGWIAGDPGRHNRVGGLAYITQAGIGLGLAKQVAVEFPGWGDSFATVLIAVIVINQISGPPLFKWAIHRVGEAHPRGVPDEDTSRDAVIFGLEGQSLALARQLEAHGWQTKIACRRDRCLEDDPATDLRIIHIDELSVSCFRRLDVQRAEAVVAMLSDEENYRICELAYENFGTRNLVVRLHDRNQVERFRQLDALIVEPSTAMVGLLDHSVRSPRATSLLLGMVADQDVIDVEVRDPELDGVALRDLNLPLDVLLLSVQRGGQVLISHGYTCLAVGDSVTVVGSEESLEEVARRFGSPGGPA